MTTPPRDWQIPPPPKDFYKNAFAEVDAENDRLRAALNELLEALGKARATIAQALNVD